MNTELLFKIGITMCGFGLGVVAIGLIILCIYIVPYLWRS